MNRKYCDRCGAEIQQSSRYFSIENNHKYLINDRGDDIDDFNLVCFDTPKRDKYDLCNGCYDDFKAFMKFANIS